MCVTIIARMQNLFEVARMKKLSIVSLLVFAVSLHAQQKRQPCMLMPEARQFDFWVGSWKVYVTGTKQVAGHSEIQIISGGCGILENWTGAGGDEGKSINYFHPTQHEWQQVWVGSGNNPNRVQVFVHGEYKDGTMRFDGQKIMPQGNLVKVRFRFVNLGDRVEQIHETSEDGTTWTKSYDFTYVRDEAGK